MGQNVIEVSTASFDSEIKGDHPVLADFWAAWCGPCRRVAPIVEELAKDYAGKLKVIKINVDDNPDLAARYQVMSIPTLLFIKNGAEVDKVVGAVPKNILEEKIKTLI